MKVKEIISPRQVAAVRRDGCFLLTCIGDSCVAQTCEGYDCREVTCSTRACGTFETLPIITDLPDLVPVETKPLFCDLDDQGRLIVTVKNQGTATAASTVTRVRFLNVIDPRRAVVDAAAPEIVPDAQVNLEPISIPPISGADVNFTITVDFGNTIVEANEDNNTVSGRCIG